MRTVISAAAVVTVEVGLWWRYAQMGAEFHFWLHGLLGGAIGVAAATVWALARGRRPGAVWGSGFAGHVWSAFPDVLFISAGILHQLWMDAFAFHIAIHLIAAPLVTMLGVFALTLLAWLLASWGRPALAGGAIGLAAGVTTVALLLAPGIPTSIEQLRESPQIALLCPLRDIDVEVAGR
ncbi:hypothetical protein [Euzebya pacifica]|jgi:hypothetical protein|uniref:hypothetical protein n=1 Tax=Euzebya pacifica TaxID=1608957 RepID=UPI0030F61F57